jgi:uncharacterized protein (TIGR00369 family)
MSADPQTGEEYPPPHHLIRDLAVEVEHRDDRTSSAWLTVVPELLDDGGHVRAGVLATVVDMIGGGLSAQVASPDWIATADLTLHLVRGATGGVVQADARVLRAGRTTVVIEVRLHGTQPATPLGLATMTFSVLPHRAGNPVISFGTPARSTLVLPGSGFESPVLEALDVAVVDAAAGVVEVPVTPYSRNSLGSLQGGVVALAADVAGGESLRAACGAPVRVTDLQITYLALVRGRLRTSTEVLHASPTHGAAAVEVVDVGAEARRTTSARVAATTEG